MPPPFVWHHIRRRGHWAAGARGIEEPEQWPTRIERFVEPCLLLLLCEEPRHGYSLRDELQKRGFAHDEPDLGNLYRTLRHMEEVGLVNSDWAEEGPRPLKRVYRITPAGRKFLQVWVAGLRQTKEALDNFLKAYRAQFPEEGR